MPVMTSLKNRLVKRGPNSRLLLQAFRLQAALHGISMHTGDGKIVLTRGRQRVVLGKRDVISVPFVVHEWEQFFATLEGKSEAGQTVLDFSEPGLHKYRKTGLSFYTPSLAEEDSMEAYTASYRPQPGEVVWDVGAHAGMSSYFLAQMVGPAGKVYAFEPDDTNYEFLLRNIQMHQLNNVEPIKAAISDKTGTAMFYMDGTMSAGLSESLAYMDGSNLKHVETLSIHDACERLGCRPNYIKMDIEGAELSAIASSIKLLEQHPIQFAIESNHFVNGQLTSGPLEEIFRQAGYKAWSSDEFGQRFTWAKPLE